MAAFDSVAYIQVCSDVWDTPDLPGSRRAWVTARVFLVPYWGILEHLISYNKVTVWQLNWVLRFTVSIKGWRVNTWWECNANVMLRYHWNMWFLIYILIILRWGLCIIISWTKSFLLFWWEGEYVYYSTCILYMEKEKKKGKERKRNYYYLVISPGKKFLTK